MRPDLPTGTVTFLFTDIEGSTRLLHSLGPDAYAEALAEHRRVLRDAFAAHDGVEVDTQGDAFFVAFPTAVGAAAAAREANEALRDGPISVRMGLHTGSPSVTAEGYVGVDVHQGARVAALSHGGQIVVSPTTAALLDGEELHDVGQHRLKDFDGSIRLQQLGTDEFPPLRTPGSVDLPTPATRFIGRDRELFDAVSLVYETDPRVLTIVGPGGTGKTRFAIELARLLADEADGATLFLPLAPVRDAKLVLPALATRLGAGSADTSAIAGAIRERRTHVVVDNLEHLLPGAARPLADVVAAAPTLRFIATSREPLRIAGETQFDLPPLVDDDGVTLFVERARAVRADVQRTHAVEEVCRRLDHLPLALELAAARTKLLAPEQLLERIAQRLDLPGARDADERHATLRATIAWSYDLLSDDERRLFRRLSVFRGGCTIESAEAVCDAELDTLGSLLDKSLIRRRTGRLGEERFWILETIREFAAEQLDASDEADEIRRRHVLQMLEIARSAHLGEDDLPSDIHVGLAELDNLRAALDWGEEREPLLALELATNLQHFWNASSPDEGMQRFERLLAATPSIPDHLYADALRVYGGTLDLSGRSADAEELWEESLERYRALRDDRGVSAVEHMLAISAWRREDWMRMRELTERSLTLARGRFAFIEITGLYLLGQLALVDGDIERATTLTRQSAEMARAAGWTWWESGQLHALLMMGLERGDIDDAEREGLAALRLEREHENRLWALYTIAGLAQVAHARGDLNRAGILWGAAEREAERIPRWPSERSRRGGPLLDEPNPVFRSGVERGRAVDLWDAVAIALGDLDPPQTEP
jgi:predicted ATPase